MDWFKSRLDQLQNLGGKAYGAVKNKPPSKPKIANLPADYKSTEAAAFKAAEKMKVGGKGFSFGPEQADALIGILSPVMELLNKRRR